MSIRRLDKELRQPCFAKLPIAIEADWEYSWGGGEAFLAVGCWGFYVFTTSKVISRWVQTVRTNGDFLKCLFIHNMFIMD